MFLYVIYFVAFNYRDDFFNYKMIFLRLSFTFFSCSSSHSSYGEADSRVTRLRALTSESRGRLVRYPIGAENFSHDSVAGIGCESIVEEYHAVRER